MQKINKSNKPKPNALTQYDDTEVKKIKHSHNGQKNHFNHRSMSYKTAQKGNGSDHRNTLKTFHASLLFYNNETRERASISSLELLFISSLL